MDNKHNEHDQPRDPLNLDAVDRDIRINELTEQLNALGPSNFHVSDDCPPEVQEQFLENVLAYETAPMTSASEQLIEAGTPLPSPDSLDDAALTATLWAVIKALAEQDTYLHHTDHLSDRQLYEYLWTDALHETMPRMPRGSGWTNHLDPIGSGDDEAVQIALRYYDNEKERQRWANDFPDCPIPPHEDLPYDRDRLLPKSPDEIRRLQILAEMEAAGIDPNDLDLEADEDPAP